MIKRSAVFLTIFLASCVIPPQSATKTSIATGVEMPLLLPTRAWSETRKVTALYRQEHHTLIIQVQATPQKIVMAGLTPTGTRLFSLSFDGHSIESWQSPLFTAPFDGSYLLADFELATFDLITLRQALPDPATIFETGQALAIKERTVKNAQGVTVIRIEYQGTETRYCHLERHYCLQIEQLP